MTEKNPWTLLGLRPTSDEEAIRNAYLKKVRQHHPDLYHRDAPSHQAHEEQMKWINWAYTQVMTNLSSSTIGDITPWTPPPKAPPTPTGPPLSCAVHHQPIIRYCVRCREPLCSTCLGFTLSLCPFHFRKFILARFRRRVLWEWGGLAAMVIIGKLMFWPLSTLLWSILGYLAGLGILELRRLRYFGCITWLFIPYSLVLAGLYSLYEGLSRWNHEMGDLHD